MSARDRISKLPSSIIETILLCLPLEEAARTSVLSKAWRYEWGKLPQLTFDASKIPSTDKGRGKVLMMIYSTLFHHPGPIFQCSINNCGLISSSDMDNIMQLLSSKGVRDLALSLSDDDEPGLLPRHIFSCSQLKHLSLRSFLCMTRPTVNAFGELISLELIDVEFHTDSTGLLLNMSITGCPLLERFALECLTNIDSFSIHAPNLKSFRFRGVIKQVVAFYTPLLGEFTLLQYNEIFDLSSFDLLKIFRDVPLLEILCVCYSLQQMLDYEREPAKRAVLLQNLKYLELVDMDMMQVEELPRLFGLTTNFPLIRKLKFQIKDWPDAEHEHVLGYVEQVKYYYSHLNYLCEVEIQGFTGSAPELALIKFLLAISPQLETMHVFPDPADVIESGSKIFIALTRFHRASSKAEIIVHGDW